DLIARWIAGLDGDGGTTGLNSGPPDTAPTSPGSAMRLARKLGRGELDAPERDALLATAAKLPGGPIRDLFEGYLPSDDRRGRTLGSNPRPRAVLALEGDPRRGETLFWSEAVQCGRCHRIGDRGTAVGPDLTTIGRLRSREDLLASLLEP